MNFWKAPFYSLYSVDFYRQVIASPLRKGFFYLFYLTAIATLVFFLSLAVQTLPQMDRFVDWIRENLPPLVWTGEKLEVGTGSPYVMVHPEFGVLAAFDTSLEDVTAEKMGEARIFFTATRAYVKKGAGEIGVYDLKEVFGGSSGTPKRIRLSGDLINDFYKAWRPWGVGMAILFYFPFFFLWKLLAALSYSVIGVLINTLRRQRLAYRSILNASFFAMTAVTLVQLTVYFLPFLAKVPFSFFIALLVTGGYLYLAVKMTEGPENEISSRP